jgi:hypothetical protein
MVESASPVQPWSRHAWLAAAREPYGYAPRPCRPPHRSVGSIHALYRAQMQYSMLATLHMAGDDVSVLNTTAPPDAALTR